MFKNINTGPGAPHWYIQRVSGIITSAFILWTLYIFISNASNIESITNAIDLIVKSSNCFTAIFLATLFLHMFTGIETVLEDYVTNNVAFSLAISSVKVILITLFFISTRYIFI